MPDFTRLTSIFGRRLALSSSGGLVNSASHAFVSRDATGTLQDTLRSYVETISSSGAQMVNRGLSILSSASATARAVLIAAPLAGLEKVIYSVSSASVITISGSATTTIFQTSGAGTTVMTITAGGGATGEGVRLIGLSTTRWGMLGKTGGVA